MNGIYPGWKIFMSSTNIEKGIKSQNRVRLQESARNSIKRVFRVLFKRFNELNVPSMFLYSEDMCMVLKDC